MTKKLNADEQFVLDAVQTAEATFTVRQLMVFWARERGTKENVVAWPRKVVNDTLFELEDRGLLAVRLRREGTAA
jgi:hypothetical protein